MHIIRKIKISFILLTLPLVIWLYYNQLSNWHYHVLDNGIIVKHAHPYSSDTLPGTPYQQHKHSNAEFFFLSLIAAAVSLLAFLFIIGEILRNRTCKMNACCGDVVLLSEVFINNTLRAPPVGLS